ncbi:MAG: hypothetical protein C0514_07920 [Candidatus Puniceispirillum sp.]|nr:hypothetical protein [Candidatus Puniceispirillum sp.]
MKNQTLVLLEGVSCFVFQKSHWQETSQEHIKDPCVVLFDQCAESFIADKMPTLSLFERASYGRHRVQTLASTHTLFYARASKDNLLGASANLTFSVLEGLSAPLMGVGLLAWEIARAIQKPTILLLTLPSGAQRLYLFDKGAPLFVRTLATSPHEHASALEATLYHIERHFQMPRASLTHLTWSAHDLARHFMKHPKLEMPFLHPWQSQVSRAKLMRASVQAAPFAVAMSLSLAMFLSAHVWRAHGETKILSQTLADTKQRRLKQKAHPNAPLLSATAPFEKLHARTSPLQDLKTLAPLNTPDFQPQGLTWHLKEKASHITFEVCATKPMTHAALEDAVEKCLLRSPRTFHLSAHGVITLDDISDAPACITGETSEVPRP